MIIIREDRGEKIKVHVTRCLKYPTFSDYKKNAQYPCCIEFGLGEVIPL